MLLKLSAGVSLELHCAVFFGKKVISLATGQQARKMSDKMSEQMPFCTPVQQKCFLVACWAVALGGGYHYGTMVHSVLVLFLHTVFVSTVLSLLPVQRLPRHRFQCGRPSTRWPGGCSRENLTRKCAPLDFDEQVLHGLAMKRYGKVFITQSKGYPYWSYWSSCANGGIVMPVKKERDFWWPAVFHCVPRRCPGTAAVRTRHTLASSVGF